MRKKYLLAASILVLAVSFAACGKKEDKNTDKGSTAEATTEAEADQDTEKDNEDAQAQEDDPFSEAYKVISDGGFTEDGFSNYSYTIHSDSIKDCGDYYEVTATFSKAVTVPADIAVGDVYTITTNELTGDSENIVCSSEGIYYQEGEDPDSSQGYYSFPDGVDEDGNMILYCDSDDRVDADFYEGVLFIDKNAETGVAIEDSYHTLTEDDLKDNVWFNGVKFDEDGYVTNLVHFGD